MSAVLPDARTLDGLIARASDPKHDRWLEQVRRPGACRHPLRRRGAVLRGDELVYSTATEPDGALMVSCASDRRTVSDDPATPVVTTATRSRGYPSLNAICTAVGLGSTESHCCTTASDSQH
jgi:hypothetical protein